MSMRRLTILSALFLSYHLRGGVKGTHPRVWLFFTVCHHRHPSLNTSVNRARYHYICVFSYTSINTTISKDMAFHDHLHVYIHGYLYMYMLWCFPVSVSLPLYLSPFLPLSLSLSLSLSPSLSVSLEQTRQQGHLDTSPAQGCTGGVK